MADKIPLGAGCSYSRPAVNPKNWKTQSASIAKPWMISCRFYEPGRKPKPLQFRCGTEYKNLAARQGATRTTLEWLRHNLEDLGWNPNDNTFSAGRPDPDVPNTPPGIGPHSSLARALGFAIIRRREKKERELRTLRGDKPEGTPNTETDIRSYCRRIIAVVPAKPVGEYEMDDFLQGMEKLAEKGNWSPYAWNNCHTALLGAFKMLVKTKAIKHNPIAEIDRMELPDKDGLEAYISPETRADIAAHLAKIQEPDYLRALRIFFASGDREAEMCEVKIKFIDLDAQTYKTWERKGRKVPRLVTKAIKDAVLGDWRELVGMAKDPEDFLFSKNFRPGPNYHAPARWNRWWKDLVKEPLGLSFDCYDLKKAHTTEVARESKQMAADFNKHSSTAMNEKHYDLKSEQERLEARKRDGVSF